MASFKIKWSRDGLRPPDPVDPHRAEVWLWIPLLSIFPMFLQAFYLLFIKLRLRDFEFSGILPMEPFYCF